MASEEGIETEGEGLKVSDNDNAKDVMAICFRLEELTSLAARQTLKQASVALMSRKQ